MRIHPKRRKNVKIARLTKTDIFLEISLSIKFRHMRNTPHEPRQSAPRPSLAISEKWGEVARAGFQVVPDLLLKHQNDLEINPTEMVVLLNVLMHWWYRDQKPFPRSTTIARRMGSNLRTVQRALQNLEHKGLLLRQKGPADETLLDPEPLVARLRRYTVKDRDYQIRTALLA